MKIGVLNTDKLKPELSLRYGEYPSMFARLLLTAKPDLKLQTYNVVDFQYPKTIDECDAYLITGSKLSVYDEIPWIIELKNFVRKLNTIQKKIHQIQISNFILAEILENSKERKKNTHIHISRFRRIEKYRSRWSPYH